MVAEVLLELEKLDKTFCYLIPKLLIKECQIGIRALVSFNNRILQGFIINILNENKFDYELKEIISLVDEKSILNEELLSLGKYISKKTLCTLTSAYQTMLPVALKAKVNNKINKKIVTYI